MITKDPLVSMSGLVHSRFPDTLDPVPADFRSANADPELVDIRCPTAPITVSTDLAPPSNPDLEHSDLKDPSAATSKNPSAIVHSPKLSDSFFFTEFQAIQQKKKTTR